MAGSRPSVGQALAPALSARASTAAMPRGLAAPLAWTSRMTGAEPLRRGEVGAAAEARAPGLACGERDPRVLRDRAPLLLGERGVDVQHEGALVHGGY
jgi:hypothetical protein